MPFAIVPNAAPVGFPPPRSPRKRGEGSLPACGKAGKGWFRADCLQVVLSQICRAAVFGRAGSWEGLHALCEVQDAVLWELHAGA